MPLQPPKRLSDSAMTDLKAIVACEIPETMTDDEIEEMGMRLLRLFSLLSKPRRVSPVIQPSEDESKVLQFIKEESRQGRSPSVRSIAKTLDLRSSRSGAARLKVLMSKGWVARDKQGKLTVTIEMNVVG